MHFMEKDCIRFSTGSIKLDQKNNKYIIVKTDVVNSKITNITFYIARCFYEKFITIILQLIKLVSLFDIILIYFMLVFKTISLFSKF